MIEDTPVRSVKHVLAWLVAALVVLGFVSAAPAEDHDRLREWEYHEKLHSLLQEDHVVEAIELCREFHDTDLQEANSAVQEAWRE